MEITNSIRLPKGNIPVTVIATIRKGTGLSICEIKERALNGDSLVESNLSDDIAIENIIKLYYEIENLGIRPVLSQGGREVSIEFMENLLAAHRHTAKEVGLD